MSATSLLNTQQVLLAESSMFQLGDALFTEPKVIIDYMRHVTMQRKSPGFLGISTTAAKAALERLQRAFPLATSVAPGSESSSSSSASRGPRGFVDDDSNAAHAASDALASGAGQGYRSRHKVRLASKVNKLAGGGGGSVDLGLDLGNTGLADRDAIGGAAEDGHNAETGEENRDIYQVHHTLNYAIHPIAKGMVCVQPSETVISDIIQVFGARLAVTTAEPGSLSAELAVNTLLQEIIGVNGDIPEHIVDSFIPDVVSHIDELERGPSKFDVIVIEALADSASGSTLRSATDQTTYLSLWRQSFMAIPHSVVQAHPKLMDAFKTARSNKSALWRDYDYLGNVDMMASCKHFMHMDAVTQWYDKDLWVLCYLRQLAVYCRGSTTYEEYATFREWFYQAAHLVALSRGVITRPLSIEDRRVNMEFFSDARVIEVDWPESGDCATASLFVNSVDMLNVLPWIIADTSDSMEIETSAGVTNPREESQLQENLNAELQLFRGGGGDGDDLQNRKWSQVITLCSEYIIQRCAHVKKTCFKKTDEVVKNLTFEIGAAARTAVV